MRNWKITYSYVAYINQSGNTYYFVRTNRNACHNEHTLNRQIRFASYSPTMSAKLLLTWYKCSDCWCVIRCFTVVYSSFGMTHFRRSSYGSWNITIGKRDGKKTIISLESFFFITLHGFVERLFHNLTRFRSKASISFNIFWRSEL